MRTAAGSAISTARTTGFWKLPPGARALAAAAVVAVHMAPSAINVSSKIAADADNAAVKEGRRHLAGAR